MTSPLKRQSLSPNSFLIMSLDSTQFVSSNFAEFLLDNANNGNEILAVLDDIVEVQDTVL